MSKSEVQSGVVNCLGAPWPEDLSAAFIDQLHGQGVTLVGCTGNLTWDDTLESIENFEIVKTIVREHPRAYILRSGRISSVLKIAAKSACCSACKIPRR